MDRRHGRATALHVGFQLTVTVLVYPALARTRAAYWSNTHQRHSRNVVWLRALAELLTGSPSPPAGTGTSASGAVV